jgi:hypothetical protein
MRNALASFDAIPPIAGAAAVGNNLQISAALAKNETEGRSLYVIARVPNPYSGNCLGCAAIRSFLAIMHGNWKRIHAAGAMRDRRKQTAIIVNLSGPRLI